METNQVEAPKFTFEAVQKENAVGSQMGWDLTNEREGPIAMTYDMELGWVAEALGPTSGHWKRKACEGQTKDKERELSPMQEKKKCFNLFNRVRPEQARNEEKESGGAGKKRECG